VSIPIEIRDSPRHYSNKKSNIYRYPEMLRLEVEWGERYMAILEKVRLDRDSSLFSDGFCCDSATKSGCSSA